MDKRKRTIILTILGLLVSIGVIISLSYAYFAVNINDQVNSHVHVGAINPTILEFSDGSISLTNAIPGDVSTEVPFTATYLKGKDVGPLFYDIEVEIEENTFTSEKHSGQIILTITNTDTNKVKRIDLTNSTKFSAGSTTTVMKAIQIDPGTATTDNVQHYTAKIEFVELDIPQDENRNATLKCKVRAEEVEVMPTYTATTLNKTKLYNFVEANAPERLIITDVGGHTDGTDVGTDAGHIYAWMDGTTAYVSAKDAGHKIKMPSDSSAFFALATFDELMQNSSSMQESIMSSKYATSLNYMNLELLDTSAVTNMNSMFVYFAMLSGAVFEITGLESWDVSRVTDMSYVFSDAGHSATSWSIGDLSNWDVSNVTNMGGMFGTAGYSATSSWSIGDLSNWDVSNVTDMNSMFGMAGRNATTWSIGDLSSWDTSSVTNMGCMFYFAGHSATSSWSIGDLSGWDTSSVTDMHYMFSYAGYSATSSWSIGDLSSWDVSNVTNMINMFAGAGYTTTTFNLDLSSWDVSNVTNMNHMFYEAGYNAPEFKLNLSGWDTSNVTNMGSMFSGAGYKATGANYVVKIPVKTGTTNNDTTHFYGSGTTYASLDSGKYFTLAS